MKIEEMGEFGFIDHITRRQKENINSSTILGIGDDAAVIAYTAEKESVISADMLIEGINFDLSYTPLKHLGFKCVVVALADIIAMGATPRQIMVSIGVTSGFSVEMIDELYEGIDIASKEYGVDLVGGDTAASYSGLIISLTAIGHIDKGMAIKRSGAKSGEIICITGDVASSFLGQKLLEREKQIGDTKNMASILKEHTAIISKALKPTLRTTIIEELQAKGLRPTSMIDLADGIASEILHICKKSEVGARIFIDRLPISENAIDAGEELGIDPIIASMNGGDDYEFMFTLPAAEHEKVEQIEGVTIVGYITDKEFGAKLLTAQNHEISIVAQGHK